MKDLLLILVMLALFAFGYFIMGRVDRLIEKNQRLIADGTRSRQSKIRIAAEDPSLLDAVAPALKRCSDADPHLALFLSSGNTGRIGEKLLAEQLDIILLDGDGSDLPDGPCAWLRIPCGRPEQPDETSGEGRFVRVVWNKRKKSKDRDRVIFALETEHCRLKCGYAGDLEK